MCFALPIKFIFRLEVFKLLEKEKEKKIIMKIFIFFNFGKLKNSKSNKIKKNQSKFFI